MFLHNRYLYGRPNSYFWAAKKDVFASVAEEILAGHKHSGTAVTYIASYFSGGLHMHTRAIDVMFEAHRGGLLNDAQIYTLVSLLHGQRQWAKSIPLLEPLAERHLLNLNYRTKLMVSYYHTARKDDLLAQLKATHDYFHLENRWNESVMATLANSCNNTELYKQSADYYTEAIGVHQRSHPNRGIGNGTLSNYFSQLAYVNQKLGRTKEAVDAAAGAIVSWGRNQSNRKYALRTLTSILRQANDRDAYAAFLDKEAKRTAEDRPIVRKALAQAYISLQQHKKAVAQLKIAVEFQPNDKETHQLLLASYDALNDKDAAIQQLFAFVQLDRRNIELYKNLGDRLSADPDRERAYTSIVEIKPSESDAHAMLAKVRQEQGRWNDAIGHWRQVSLIRSPEPTGLLGLAKAQLHLGQWKAADDTLDKLESTTWPPRFGNVKNETRRLRSQLGSRQKPAAPNPSPF